MASILPSYDSSDEEYIEMDLISCSTNYSPPQSQSREFEFQFCFISKETPTNSPADELFYKGKLLPLHRSPRLRMLQKLLLQSSKAKEGFAEENAPSSTPPEESGNNTSPSDLCRVNTDTDEHFFEWSNELSSFIHHHSNHPKKSWSKKLKLVKNSIVGPKLKAYLKSLFSKPDESFCAKAAACNVEPENLSKNKKPSGNIEGAAAYPRLATTIVKSIEKEGIHEDNIVQGRSSFSGAINKKGSSSSNSSSGASSLSSSSCSFNSNAFPEFHFLRRSSSATEIEGSIEAAIAHCKNSQLLFGSRNTYGFSSFPGIPAAKNQQRPDVCSI